MLLLLVVVVWGGGTTTWNTGNDDHEVAVIGSPRGVDTDAGTLVGGQDRERVGLGGEVVGVG